MRSQPSIRCRLRSNFDRSLACVAPLASCPQTPCLAAASPLLTRSRPTFAVWRRQPLPSCPDGFRIVQKTASRAFRGSLSGWLWPDVHRGVRHLEARYVDKRSLVDIARANKTDCANRRRELGLRKMLQHSRSVGLGGVQQAAEGEARCVLFPMLVEGCFRPLMPLPLTVLRWCTRARLVWLRYTYRRARHTY